MAFKHIRHSFTTANSWVALYTVPTGRERARNGTAIHPTVSFANNSNTVLATLDTTDDAIVVADSGATLFTAGQAVKGRSTATGAVGEIIGLELPAGTWSTIKLPTQ